MAYLDLRFVEGLAAVPATEPVQRSLGRPERQAVAVALSEGRTALLLGKVSRIFGRLWLGMNDEPVFASERLEAIRRYAVHYRLEGDGLPPVEDDRLRAADVDELEAAELRSIVDAHLVEKPKRRGRRFAGQVLAALLLAAIPVMGAAGLYSWLTGQVEDRPSALVLSIALVVALVSPVLVAGQPFRRSA